MSDLERKLVHSLVSKSRVFELTRFVEVRRFIYVSIQLNDFFFDIVECGFNSIDAFEDLARRLVEVLVEMEEDRSKSISFKFEEFFRKRFGAVGKSVTVALPVGPCANGKTATLLLTRFHPCSLGRFRSLTPLGNHAPSGPSLRIGATCGFRSRLNGRSAGEDWKVGLGRGILKRGEWFFSRSSLFRIFLVYATRGDIWAHPGAQIVEMNSRRSAEEREAFFRCCRHAF